MDCSIELDTKILIGLLLILGFTTNINGRFEFTNMECIANDQKFGQFEYCYLKSVNRTYKYASMKYLTSQTPFNNIVITVALMKRLNGYKPFLYDFSFDYCRYMRNPENPGNKVITFFYSLFKPYSNINHTCPYTHDLIVDKAHSVPPPPTALFETTAGRTGNSRGDESTNRVRGGSDLPLSC